MSGPGITNFPDGMIAAGRTKAAVVKGDHIPIGDSEDDNKVKVASVEAIYDLIAGTPPETLDTLAKLASAINNDPAFHTTLATALGLKQDASNAVTTDTTQTITGVKTYDNIAPLQFKRTSGGYYPFQFFFDGVLQWRWYQTGTDILVQHRDSESNYTILMRFNHTSKQIQFDVSPTVPTATSSDNSTLAASTAFVQAQKVDTALTGTPTAPTAATGTNTTQLANCAFVQAALAGAAGVPAGVICMWSGTIATVPTGWALCDGANGTPDLVDRFVVAAGVKSGGDKYDPGDTGGLDSVTLDLTQIPAHTHAGTTGGGGAHTHIVGVPYWSGASGSATMIDKRDSADDDPAFSATASVQPAPDHTHGFTTDSKGGGQSHENRPPYYALAFIMKL